MTRYFVTGYELAKWTFLKELDYTTDPQDNFDIVCLLPGTNINRLGEQLLDNRRLLTPIANFTGRRWPRADFRASKPSLEAFTSAAQALQPLCVAVAAIDIRNSSDYPSLAILGLAHSRNTGLTASRAPALAELVEYPLLAAIPKQRRLLEDLASGGLLERQHFDRLYFCENCGSSRMHVREECSSCRSSDLNDVSLVHHYRCGYQGIETAFRQQDHLECPKCQKELRHYGVDYDKPKAVHSCGACGEVSNDPAIGFICNDCSQHADAASLATREWYNYELSPSGVAALQAGLLPHNSVQTLLSKSVGICSIGEFVVTTAQLLKIAERFERPLCACAIHINNFEELRDRFGVSNLASAFLLLGEIIAQIVRNTDLVSAREQTIYLLLAETEADNLQIVEQRLQQETSKRISLPLDLTIERYPRDKLAQLLRTLG
ncbi:diguanylate cyclase [Pseudomaricurvus alcaniphilus]|uniref:TackOD1 domain-containing metal-binding protein n=1 Tax=Pseudomaricurvus alcaniphilus TaxID=1166482 RepID=UPI00140B4B74|nr:diguanylate cyclase [Pseudomaricurvus alcaniphilus]NHN35885.1 diguanylate cyclase [Pseudomaricurvus alcaniphilus]